MKCISIKWSNFKFDSLVDIFFLITLFLLISYPSIGQTIYHVNGAIGNDNSDGLSWGTALKTLQVAIDKTQNNSGDQIWVVAGTYYPTADNPLSTVNNARDVSLYLNKNIKIYGGFSGTETALIERHPTNNVTILSGDIGTINNNADNAFHVLVIDGTSINGDITNECLIDGFTIEKGNTANGAFIGGGIYNNAEGAGNICSPTISNCIFSENYAKLGGAIYSYGEGESSSPLIIKCTFSNNSADQGGAIFNNGYNGESSPSIINCTFLGNTADRDGGAILNQHHSKPSISNCIFSGNSASEGGAISFQSSGFDISAQLSNCLFINNGAHHINYGLSTGNLQPHFRNCTFAGATSFTINIPFWESRQTPIDFTNCIFWGNNKDIVGGNLGDNSSVNIQYSIVEESAFANTNNNIYQDPQFKNVGNGDFRQLSSSPAMNSGTTIAGITTDLDGQLRPFNGQFDIGAFEIQLGPDTDSDGVIDSLDLCNGGNDRVNTDRTGMPDDCDCDPTSSADDEVEVTGIITQDTIKSSFILTTDGTVNNGITTVLQAGNSIILQTGFTAHVGSDFTARIDYCRTPPTQLTNEELASVARTSNEQNKAIANESINESQKENNIVNEFMTTDWWTGPNPFRQYFTIQTTLSKDVESVSVLVYDQTGRLANAVIFETPLTAGTHEWQVDGASIPLGMAYLILQVGEERLVKKVIRVE